PSSSLIPQDDPTLLLTSAGMVQMKPYFLGEVVPSNLRLASCQKCFRTTDIELVGDPTHNTFFEMLGNFSVGDYFKEDAIAWAWEFFTQNLKLPPERLSATIFLDDDEAFQHWREIGLPEERIFRFDEEDNFWGPVGDSGPCGPDTEIFYDFGEGIGCGESSCAPNCACGRFVEIATLVFMQYNQDKDGQRTLLPKPSIDTGTGMERTTAVVQGRTSIYETDLFTPLIERVSALSGKKYGIDDSIDNAIRVVAEHSRAVAFLIGDGVMPSNEGRGYVLRRLLRRAALFGRRLGLEGKFLAETVKVTIKQMGHIYPELVQRQDFILKIIELEQEGFNETLSTGLELLDGIMEKTAGKKANVISGKDTFKLYDTYGFPVELTKEIAVERGFFVDMEGFDKEMDRQRKRAKAAQKFDLADRNSIGVALDIKDTVFTGYSNHKQNTTILGLLVDNDSAGSVNEGQEAGLVLTDTPFYGEMGGQIGDTGVIIGEKGRFLVTDTVRILPDIIVHRGKVEKGTFTVGDEVKAEVDVERRLDIARNHTATHLLQSALRQVLGGHVQQRGSLVAPDHFRFDFSHLVAMTAGEIEEVQRIVNERIRQSLEVYDEDMPYRKAIEEGVIALFDEKYADIVRVLRIGSPPISAELCGGTHINTTGEIGLFHIVSESSIGSGLRRIEAVTGRGAERYITRRLDDLEKAARYLETEPDDIVIKTQDLLAEVKNERRQRQTLERKLAKKDTESLGDKAQEISGVKVLAERVSPAGMDNLRAMSDDLRDKLGSGIVVLGTVWEDKPAFVVNVSPDLVKEGYKAGEIIKRVAEVTGGNGGGRANIAQGGGTNKDKLDDALKEAFRYVEEKHSSKR
ncbi:alanine--tRNA ligase, partial [Chloroflexota bacterium]